MAHGEDITDTPEDHLKEALWERGFFPKGY
jgi:hypothetical protein